jgi:hypothetical protein
MKECDDLVGVRWGTTVSAWSSPGRRSRASRSYRHFWIVSGLIFVGRISGSISISTRRRHILVGNAWRCARAYRGRFGGRFVRGITVVPCSTSSSTSEHWCTFSTSWRGGRREGRHILDPILGWCQSCQEGTDMTGKSGKSGFGIRPRYCRQL